MNQKPVVVSLLKEVVNNPPYSWFPSSDCLIELIINQADISLGMRVLEPNAGDGRLALAARQAGAIVEVIEIDPILRQILFQQGLKLVGSDFMDTEPLHLYPRIIANPPFSFSPEKRGVDLAIIRRAYDLFLAPGGKLVSVVSASHKYPRCPQARAFCSWSEQIKADWLTLPLEVFWGTPRPVTVETWLIIAKK